MIPLAQYGTKYHDLQEATLDYAESLLLKQMKDNPQLLMFFLKTKGRSRGYGESTTITHTANVPRGLVGLYDD